MKIQKVAAIALAALILGPMIYAAFAVALPMGLAVLFVLALGYFRD